MAHSAAASTLAVESGLARYFEDIKRFPLLEPNEEFMLARRSQEQGDAAAAHTLVTSHLRLVAKTAMGYRGYGLPISEVISEGNIGLMQAVKRFEPDRGFRLASYAIWWIRAAIQEYVLRSWSLVKIGTNENQRKLFFNLRKAKRRIAAIDDGDLQPRQVRLIAKDLGVSQREVIDMNRRLAGDASLNAPMHEDGSSGEWIDWLVDKLPVRRSSSSRRSSRKTGTKRCMKRWRRSTTASARSSKRECWPRSRSRSRSSPANSACRASASARSRAAPWKRCGRRRRTLLKPWNDRRAKSSD
jgi:alternative sigma factor RpoH